MFWDRPPTSIDKFALQKHMKEDNMLPKSLISMRNTEYEEFKDTDWARSKLFLKPKSSIKFSVENVLSD